MSSQVLRQCTGKDLSPSHPATARGLNLMAVRDSWQAAAGLNSVKHSQLPEARVLRLSIFWDAALFEVSFVGHVCWAFSYARRLGRWPVAIVPLGIDA